MHLIKASDETGGGTSTNEVVKPLTRPGLH